MNWPRILNVLFAIFFCSEFGEAGILKYSHPVDLNDELYDEISYLLQQHAAKQRGLQDTEEGRPGQAASQRIGIPHPKYVTSWPAKHLSLGQVAGVSVDNQNNPVIFHRGLHVFDSSSFDGNHRYQHIEEGPIPEDTVIALNASDGSPLKAWGRNRFYLPHGLTVDRDGNTWVTDVALHQVMKFPPGEEVPSLILGEAFVPGSDTKHFCKPTDIAVASTGVFFVSDGYCNSRILKYNSNGELLTQWGHSGERSIFAIPHSLALIEDQDLLCVADRENRRIQCFSAGLNPETPAGKFVYQISTSVLGRVYAIAYGGDGLLQGVAAENGATGFTVDLDSGDIVDTWNTRQGQELHLPHDISVAPDGRSLYVAEISPNRISKFDLQQ